MEGLYHLARFRKAHLFFVAILIFRRVAALNLYPPRLRPGPLPFNAVIAASICERRCSSFFASLRNAWTMFMNPPGVYYQNEEAVETTEFYDHSGTAHWIAAKHG
jgi:hypothetical protein